MVGRSIINGVSSVFGKRTLLSQMWWRRREPVAICEMVQTLYRGKRVHLPGFEKKVKVILIDEIKAKIIA